MQRNKLVLGIDSHGLMADHHIICNIQSDMVISVAELAKGLCVEEEPRLDDPWLG